FVVEAAEAIAAPSHAAPAHVAPPAFSPADLDLATPPIVEAVIEYRPEPVMPTEPAPHERQEPPTAIPAGLITGYDPDALSALEVTRTAVWPLVLALGVGMAA